MAELARIRDGDIVEVDVKGRVGLAFAGEVEGRRLKLSPITPGFGYFTASGRQIRRHWRLTENRPRHRSD